MVRKKVIIIAVIALSAIVIAYYLAVPSFTPQPVTKNLEEKFWKQ